MDEFSAVLRAREFVNKVNSSAIPVSVGAYAAALGAKIKYETNMQSEEDGCSTMFNGKLIIGVNTHDLPQRQRFTVCHEIAHAVLGLPSEHGTASWSYKKRPFNEVLCDVFAAELLLPISKFKPLVERQEPGFEAVEALAETFEASLASTASRFATVTSLPCAYVLSEGGKVKYCARSRAFRDLKAWVALGASIPSESIAACLRGGEKRRGAEELDADIWLNNWDQGGVVVEDSRYLSPWDQTLSLIWFEDDDVEVQAPECRLTFECDGLNELDGVLPWTGKKRRR